MPKISVVMPAYNAEQYIAEAIDSILKQTFADFEFIIIDDGSVDRTAQIVESYSDPRIRFVQNGRNLGVAATLNRGLELSQGEYIARMDADDISLPERFEKQLAYLEDHKDTAVVASAIELIGAKTGSRRFSESFEQLKLDLLFGCCFAHPSVMLRKALLDRKGFRYDPAFERMEDYDLWDRIASEYPIAALPEVLLRYRVHRAQVTHKKTQNDTCVLEEIKKRQVERLGLAAEGDGFERFLQFCDGSFLADGNNILLLNGFFDELKRQNKARRIYDITLLNNYLKNVIVNLLNKLPFKEAFSLAGACGIFNLGYSSKRAFRGAISRLETVIQTKKNRSKLKSKDFSIICNNCWGGFIYQHFGLEYSTPTIGLYILGRDFVKFAADLDRYLSSDLEFIPWESSTYYYHLRNQKPYPVARLDDIEIYFMHYHSEEEAREKWNRRKQRINRDKLLFKLSEREGCSAEDIEAFLALPLKNRICFSCDYVEGAIHVPELRNFVGDETPIVDKYYDKIQLLNSIR